MKPANSGRGTGLALIVILIVALVVAWLTVTQLKTIRAPQDSVSVQPTADLVQQARDAVDALNDQSLQGAAEPH